MTKYEQLVNIFENVFFSKVVGVNIPKAVQEHINARCFEALNEKTALDIDNEVLALVKTDLSFFKKCIPLHDAMSWAIRKAEAIKKAEAKPKMKIITYVASSKEEFKMVTLQNRQGQVVTQIYHKINNVWGKFSAGIQDNVNPDLLKTLENEHFKVNFTGLLNSYNDKSSIVSVVIRGKNFSYKVSPLVFKNKHTLRNWHQSQCKE